MHTHTAPVLHEYLPCILNVNLDSHPTSVNGSASLCLETSSFWIGPVPETLIVKGEMERIGSGDSVRANEVINSDFLYEVDVVDVISKLDMIADRRRPTSNELDFFSTFN